MGISLLSEGLYQDVSSLFIKGYDLFPQNIEFKGSEGGIIFFVII
jgi:hypothetical protein